MSLQIEPTNPRELEQLIQFLMSVFNARRDAPFLDPKLMWWKYFEPCADWPSPRSFALKQQNQMAAHAGIFPITFVIGEREVRCIHLIDWAASPTVPGAGVLLQRKLASQTGTFLTVGGSAQTRRILPKLGFRRGTDLQVYARVIRPLSQARARGFEDWKTPVRFARNLIWSRSPMPSVPNGWSAANIGQFDNSMIPLLAAKMTGEHATCKRTPGMLNYMLHCPGARFAAFLVRRANEHCGYFMLSWVNRQCRISDVRLNSAALTDWQAIYALATRTAADDPETFELQAASSVPLVTSAIVTNGFRLRDSVPVFLSDPGRLLSDAVLLHLNFLDGEGSYLNDPAHPFLT